MNSLCHYQLYSRTLPFAFCSNSNIDIYIVYRSNFPIEHFDFVVLVCFDVDAFLITHTHSHSDTRAQRVSDDRFIYPFRKRLRLCVNERPNEWMNGWVRFSFHLGADYKWVQHCTRESVVWIVIHSCQQANAIIEKVFNSHFFIYILYSQGIKAKSSFSIIILELEENQIGTSWMILHAWECRCTWEWSLYCAIASCAKVHTK